MDERALEVGGRGTREGFFVDRREALIEDEEGILDERMRFEKAAQEAIEECIAECREDHALMVTHIHIDGRAVARTVKIDGFDIAVDALATVSPRSARLGTCCVGE